MGKRVFISHSSIDKRWADWLCNRLEGMGISCWIAPRDIKPSQSWASAIVSGIKDCTILVLLLSENAMASKHVQREVELADGKNKILVTVRLDDTPLSGDLEYFLRLPQHINCFRTDFDKHIDKVVQVITHHLPDYEQYNLDTSVPKLWQQFNANGLTVVMARFNDRKLKQWEQSGLVGYGDVMAQSELQAYLGKVGITNYSLTFADQLHKDLLEHNLIMLGGDVNTIGMRFMRRVKPNIVQGNGMNFEDKTNSKRYDPSFEVSKDSQQIITDYGLIVYTDNPFAQGRKALYIAGCYGFGTWGGVQYSTSYRFMQDELVQRGMSLECLVAVDVKHETPQTVTPLVMRSLPKYER